MHEATLIAPADQYSSHEHHAAILHMAEALIPKETDLIAAMANVASLLFYSLLDINWCGFYRKVGNRLIIGPFQGKPACIEIPLGRGVCGRAALERHTIIVDDVHSIADHIACDLQSRSEIVVPLVDSNAVIGVLDLDSPCRGRFTQQEAKLLEQIAQLVVERSHAKP